MNEIAAKEIEELGVELARAHAVIRSQADELVRSARRIRELETEGADEQSHTSDYR